MATLAESRPGRSRKVLVVSLGQSNNGLTAELAPPAGGYDKIDFPDPRISEVSRGEARSRYRVADAGELHMFQHPSQDDAGGICMRLQMGKTLLQLFPDVAHVAFLCVSKGGTGFTSTAPDQWTTDGTFLTAAAVTEANAFLAANPDFEVVFTHLGGATDAGNAHPVNTWKAQVIALAEYLRTNITGAADAPWIQGDTHQSLRKEINVLSSSSLGDDYAAEIGDISSWLSNSVAMTMFDLKANPDRLHLTPAGVREVGRRCAAALYRLGTFKSADESLAGTNGSADLRFDPDSGEFLDFDAPAFRILDSYVTESDPEMGDVIRITAGSLHGTGLETSYRISPYAHTLYALIKLPVANPPGVANILSPANNIFSGHFVEQGQAEADSHFFAVGTCSNRGGAADGFITGFAAAAEVDRVHFLAKTYDGKNNRFYLDGELISTADDTEGAVDLDQRRHIVRIGSWNGLTNSTAPDLMLGAHGIRDYAMSLEDLKVLEAECRDFAGDAASRDLVTLSQVNFRGRRRISTAAGQLASAPDWRALRDGGLYYEFYITGTFGSQDLPFDLYQWSAPTKVTGIYLLDLDVTQQTPGGAGQATVTLTYVQRTRLASTTFVYPQYRAYALRDNESSPWARVGDWEHAGGEYVVDTGSGLEVFRLSVTAQNQHPLVTEIDPATD